MTDSTDSNIVDINGSIVSLLDEISKRWNTNTCWEELLLYSWGWTELGGAYLNPKVVYADDIHKYSTKNFDSFRFPRYNKDDDLSAVVYERTKNRIFLPNRNDFIIGIHANIILACRYENIVVTNVRPDEHMFAKGALHSEIGYWRF